MTSKVSVIIPTCDRPWFLDRAISSVISQDYKNIEVIVVNDGAKPLASKIRDNRVQYVTPSQNSRAVLGYGSGGYARNIGVQHATGEYLAFLDDDDLFLRHKLSHQVNLMKDIGSEISCSDAYIGIMPFKLPFYSMRFKDYYRSQLQANLSEFQLATLPAKFNARLMQLHNFVITSTAVVKASLVREVGGFNNIRSGGMRLHGKMVWEDWDLWQRISNVVEIDYFDEPLTYYKRGSLKKRLKKLRSGFGFSAVCK